MKYVFGFLVFASFFFSEVSLASAYSFTKQEMAQLTPEKLEKLSPARFNELIIIFNRSEIENEAAILYMELPSNTQNVLYNRVHNVQPTRLTAYVPDTSARTAAKHFGAGFMEGATKGAFTHLSPFAGKFF